MKQLKLTVSQREKFGSADSGRLRRARKLPAVIYGKSGTQPVVLEEPEFRKLMRAAAGSVCLVELTDDKGVTKLTLIQEVQRDSVTDQFVHVDFHEVSTNEPMHATLPVHIIGESIGVKMENGVLETLMHSVDVRCLPKNLPEYVEVNVDELHAGQAFHVKELASMEGVEFLGDPEAVIASCSEGRKATEEVEEEAPAAEGEAAEGEEKKEETAEAASS